MSHLQIYLVLYSQLEILFKQSCKTERKTQIYLQEVTENTLRNEKMSGYYRDRGLSRSPFINLTSQIKRGLQSRKKRDISLIQLQLTYLR